MEAILATASNDQVPLLGEISIGLAPSAPYITSRNLSTTYCASPGASYGSANTFTVQIASSSQWLDPLTTMITFNCVNMNTTKDLLFASSNPMALFQRYELRLAGTIVEDIYNVDRLSNLLNLYESTDRRLTTATLGFGTQETMASAAGTNPAAVTPQLYESDKHKTIRIGPGKSKRVCMSVNVSGLLNQFRWIPLWAINGPLEIRFTLQDNKLTTIQTDPNQ